MGNQSDRGQSDGYELDFVIPFGHTPKNGGANEAAQLDAAGQAIMRLLHKAAGVAEANSQQALDMAQKLSISFVRPKTGSRSKRPTSRRTRSGPTVPNSGSIKSTLMSRSDLSNGRRRSVAAS